MPFRFTPSFLRFNNIIPESFKLKYIKESHAVNLNKKLRVSKRQFFISPAQLPKGCVPLSDHTE